MKPSDLEYYRARLAAEEIAVERARHPLAAESHRRMVEGYARLIGTQGGADADARTASAGS